jgi:hypothetical protein
MPVAVIVLPETDNFTAAGSVPLSYVIVPVADPSTVTVRVRLVLSTEMDDGSRVKVFCEDQIEERVYVLATSPPVPTYPVHECPALIVIV